jgi:hypothetical protein
LDFQKDITLFIVIAAILTGLLSPILSIDFASATTDEDCGGGDDGGGNNGGSGEEPDSSPNPGLIP